MVWLLIVIVLVAGGVVLWRRRVPLLARILGQSESRIDRQINRRR